MTYSFQCLTVRLCTRVYCVLYVCTSDNTYTRANIWVINYIPDTDTIRCLNNFCAGAPLKCGIYLAYLPFGGNTGRECKMRSTFQNTCLWSNHWYFNVSTKVVIGSRDEQSLRTFLPTPRYCWLFPDWSSHWKGDELNALVEIYKYLSRVRFWTESGFLLWDFNADYQCLIQLAWTCPTKCSSV